jgi:hypothetical protein
LKYLWILRGKFFSARRVSYFKRRVRLIVQPVGYSEEKLLSIVVTREEVLFEVIVLASSRKKARQMR